MWSLSKDDFTSFMKRFWYCFNLCLSVCCWGGSKCSLSLVRLPLYLLMHFSYMPSHFEQIKHACMYAAKIKSKCAGGNGKRSRVGKVSPDGGRERESLQWAKHWVFVLGLRSVSATSASMVSDYCSPTYEIAVIISIYTFCYSTIRPASCHSRTLRSSGKLPPFVRRTS